jgi:hypothetical protein
MLEHDSVPPIYISEQCWLHGHKKLTVGASNLDDIYRGVGPAVLPIEQLNAAKAVVQQGERTHAYSIK